MKIRRMLAVLLAVLLCAALGGQIWAAAAEEPLDLTKKCTLTVNPCDIKAQIETAADLAKAGMVVDLYKVADVQADQTVYKFVPTDAFSLAVGKDIDKDGWENLAQKAANIALLPSVRKPDIADVAVIHDKVELEPGLYLLVAHKRGDTDYVKVITGKEDGESKIVTKVKTDEHLYTFMPELISLPSKQPDSNGVINTANPGGWIYDLEVNLKPQLDGMPGQLEIIKRLMTYDTAAPATFVFQIDWYENGQHHSDVRTIDFKAPGEKKIIVDGLPIGAEVTVTEVYTGVSYFLTSDREQTVTIEADETAQVLFVNDYDEESPPNGSGVITNKFTYDGKNWQWTTPVDSSEE